MALLSVRAILDPSPKDVAATLAHATDLDHSVHTELVSGTQQGADLAVTQSMGISGTAFGYLETVNFLVVRTEADFDLIVDEIWANMKKKKNGWNSKAELRAGLLSFMQSLPGN